MNLDPFWLTGEVREEDIRTYPSLRYAIELYRDKPMAPWRDTPLPVGWYIDTLYRTFDMAMKALKLNVDYERTRQNGATWRLRDVQTGDIIMGDIL